MDLLRPNVRVEPGSGTVLRCGPVVVLLAAAREAVPSEAGQFATELSAAIAPWAADPAPAAGESVRALARLLIKYRGAAPALGAAVQDGADVRLVLHGAVRALVSSPAGDVELSGLRAATWVDHLLTDPTGSIRITLADGVDLPADDGAVRDADEMTTDRATGSGMVITLEPIRAPDPVLTGPQHGRVGRFVPYDDLLPPAIHGPQRAVETKVMDNPVAALVADDGTRTLLDRDYVFGRDPQRDAGVTRGAASPVAVADPDNLISRVQVYLSVVAGVVLIRDNKSTNGTFIAAPGASEWQPLGAEPTVLPPGWSMRMGRRIFTYREAGF